MQSSGNYKYLLHDGFLFPSLLVAFRLLRSMQTNIELLLLLLLLLLSSYYSSLINWPLGC
jgi:hypothetical protein